MAKTKETVEGKVIIYVDGEKIPVRATPWSLGFDLFASEDITIGSKSVAVVGLGIKMNFNAIVAARSSIWKKWVMIANGVGIIDEDYRGEVKAPLFNFKDCNVNISKGDKLCQIIIPKEEEWDLEIRAVSREEFDNRWVENPTERGEGGIGSTDSKEDENAQWEAEQTQSDPADEQLPSDSSESGEGDGNVTDEGAGEDESSDEAADSADSEEESEPVDETPKKKSRK